MTILFNDFKDGILPSQFISELIQKNHIFSNEKITKDLIQPASLDLRLGFRDGGFQLHFYLEKVKVLKKN